MVAARPRTLSMAVVPVIVGATLAWAEFGSVSVPVTIAALLGAILIQIGTNLHNDAADFERGGDGPDRLGPPRATASGLLSSRQCKRASLACFALAGLVGLLLTAVGGWPILLLGLCSLAAGWAYSGGIRPISYSPLGEVFVIAFFGIGAVMGTAWLLSGAFSRAALASGIALGLFAAAVLLTNNQRDAVSDARAGRHTLAILLGARWSYRLYAMMVLMPFVLIPLIDLSLPRGNVWLAFLALPLAVRLSRAFGSALGAGFNQILAQTALAQVVFGGLLCLGLAV